MTSSYAAARKAALVTTALSAGSTLSLSMMKGNGRLYF